MWEVNTKPRREWTDLSFLKLDTSESQNLDPNGVWGIFETQVSCVVTGSDFRRWIGYGFADTDIDGHLTDLSKVDSSYDPIAAGKLKAHIPIWRPQEYWLKIFKIRIEKVGREWEYLIYKMELGVNQYVHGQTQNAPNSICNNAGSLTRKVEK
jgi:hypothetical protein